MCRTSAWPKLQQASRHLEGNCVAWPRPHCPGQALGWPGPARAFAAVPLLSFHPFAFWCRSSQVLPNWNFLPYDRCASSSAIFATCTVSPPRRGLSIRTLVCVVRVWPLERGCGSPSVVEDVSPPPAMSAIGFRFGTAQEQVPSPPHPQGDSGVI